MFFLAVLLSCASSVYALDDEQIPLRYIYSNTVTANLLSMECTKEQTVLVMEVRMSPFDKFRIRSSMYISDENNTHYSILGLEEESLDSAIYVPLSGKKTCRLLFPPLPDRDCLFDLIEGGETNDWVWYGIRKESPEPQRWEHESPRMRREPSDSLRIRPLSPHSYYGLERERIYAKMSDEIIERIPKLCDYWAWKFGLDDGETNDLFLHEMMTFLCERVYLLTSNDAMLQEKAYEMYCKTGKYPDYSSLDEERYSFLRKVPFDSSLIMKHEQLLRFFAERLFMFSNMAAYRLEGGAVREPDDYIERDNMIIANMKKVLKCDEKSLLIQQIIVEHVVQVAGNALVSDSVLSAYYSAIEPYINPDMQTVAKIRIKDVRHPQASL